MTEPIELPPEELMTRVLFSETKDMEDAIAIANIIKNRLARPKRFGDTLEKVIFAPKQFSGVNSAEWKKIEQGTLTPQEQEIYNQFKDISRNVIIGAISDTTGGADHYFNPKLVKPKWSEKMKKTYSTDYHEYYKE